MNTKRSNSCGREVGLALYPWVKDLSSATSEAIHATDAVLQQIGRGAPRATDARA